MHTDIREALVAAVLPPPRRGQNLSANRLDAIRTSSAFTPRGSILFKRFASNSNRRNGHEYNLSSSISTSKTSGYMEVIGKLKTAKHQ
jgi:hypothetical protein